VREVHAGATVVIPADERPAGDHASEDLILDNMARPAAMSVSLCAGVVFIHRKGGVAVSFVAILARVTSDDWSRALSKSWHMVLFL
jgi:hypothetical protein